MLHKKKSFVLERPPNPEPNKLNRLQNAIRRTAEKERIDEIERKKKEEEEKNKKETTKDAMDVDIAAEELKEVIEPEMDPEEQLKALEVHLDELNDQKHKLFLLLKQILNEDEKKRQAMELEKRKQIEQQRAIEMAQYPNGKPDSMDSPVIGGPNSLGHSKSTLSSDSSDALIPSPTISTLNNNNYPASRGPSSQDHRQQKPMSTSSPTHHPPQGGYYPPRAAMLPNYYPREPMPSMMHQPPYYPVGYQMQMHHPQMGMMGHPFSGMRPVMHRNGRGVPYPERMQDPRHRPGWRPN